MHFLCLVCIDLFSTGISSGGDCRHGSPSLANSCKVRLDCLQFYSSRSKCRPGDSLIKLWTSVHTHTCKKMEDLLHMLTFDNNFLLPPTCFIKHKPATTIIHWLDLCACRGLWTSSWCCCMIRSIVCDNCLQRELKHFLRHGMATMECSRMYGKITIAIAVLGVS